MGSIATKIGVDASKASLQVRIDRPNGRKSLNVSNDPDGVREMVVAMGQGPHLVSMEATGRYEALARRMLEEAGAQVFVQNPRRMRKLAEGLGWDAKTDKLDALVLAATVGICKPSVPRSAEREELGDLSRTIEAVKKDRSAYKKRLQTPGFSKTARLRVERLVAAMDETVAELEKDFEDAVARSALAERHKLCLGVPGVGPATARIVVAELPDDLSNLTPRQIASYAALCPVDDASGKTVRKSKLKTHGNKHLKGAFYMPAVNQIGCAPWATALYARLLSEGRTHRQAVVPVMRRMLLRVFAVAKRGSAWQADPPLGT